MHAYVSVHVCGAMVCVRVAEVFPCTRSFALVAAFCFTSLSTVLAQDHFFSDFLSLHLTTKTHKASTMMRSGVDSKTSPSASAADIDESLEASPV